MPATYAICPRERQCNRHGWLVPLVFLVLPCCYAGLFFLSETGDWSPIRWYGKGYSAAGRLERLDEFRRSGIRGYLHAYCCWFYDRIGRVRLVERFNGSGRWHGGWCEWSDGRFSVGNYRDGKKDGFERTWYSDGRLFVEGFYANGRKHGRWIQFYEDGSLMLVKWWDKGEPYTVEEGEFMERYPEFYARFYSGRFLAPVRSGISTP